MRLDAVRKSLRRWHLATTVIVMTSASAGITMALLGPDGWVPMTALGAWVTPLVLRGFLRRASEAVSARPPSLGLAIGAIFLGFFLTPIMLGQAATRIGAAVDDPQLVVRQRPLLIGWVLCQFAPFFISRFLGLGVTWAAASLLQVVLLGLMTASVQRAVVEHLEVQEKDLERVGAAAGHRVPVAVRS